MKFEDLQGFIKESLKHVDKSIFHKEVGYVITLRDSLVMASGLNEVEAEELVQFSNGEYGVVKKLERDSVFIMLLHHNSSVVEGMEIHRCHRFLTVKAGESMLNRVLDGYGNPIDGSMVKDYTEMLIDAEAHPMIERSPINKQIITGIKCIDALTPVGYGQREVILGHRGTGKSSIAIDTMLSLKDKEDVVTIYVSIGQKVNNLTHINSILIANNVKNNILVLANSSSSPMERFSAPYTALAIAEYFMIHQGKNVVVFIDDLNKHATAHREIALAMKQPVGREAYPSDMFYVHARLLERACNRSKGGSVSILPIMDIDNEDVSGYISTNVMSIVDGQIVLSHELFHGNFRPAMRVGLSLSRVGGSAQSKFFRSLCGTLRLQLAQADDYEQLVKFSSDVGEDIIEALESGKLLKMVLSQNHSSPSPLWQQILILYGFRHKYIKNQSDYEQVLSIDQVKPDLIEEGDIEYISKLLEVLCPS